MQKVIVLLVVCFFAASTVSAQQCDKKYKLKTERIVTIQADSSEGEEVPFNADIVMSKDSIVISLVLPDGNAVEISGKHYEKVCKMNTDYTSGTIDYKTDAELKNGENTRTSKMLFNVVAKDGKIKIYGVPEDQPGEKICFIIKEKEEVK